MIKKIFYFVVLAAIITVTGTNVARNFYWDVSQNKLNELSIASKNLLGRLDDQLVVTVRSPKQDVINLCETILSKYQQQTNLITIIYESNSSLDTIVLHYKDQTSNFELDTNKIDEQQFSSLLQKVLQKSNYWLVFLDGHGIADPFASDTLGLSKFTSMLKSTGVHIAQINLVEQQTIPDNVNTLIVMNPQTDLLPTEKDILREYINNGGNLWWFTEPESSVVDFLYDLFGIELTPGVIVDPASLPLGSPHPALKILNSYPDHEISKAISSATVLPWSANLQVVEEKPKWQYATFLSTNEKAWTYTGPQTMDLDALQQHVDRNGPLNLGIALQNDQQRIAIIADSSFVTNKYLAMYANHELAMNILHWIDDKPVVASFTPMPGIDTSYCPSNIDRIMYNYVWVFFVPFLFLVLGFCIRRR